MDPIPLSSSPRRLGASDLAVHPVAYGLWRFVGSDVAAARAKVEAALEVGIDFFDAADVYGCDYGGEGFGNSESLLGKLLAEKPSLRSRMVIATKGGIQPGVPYDSSPPYLRRACEDSLRRLGVDVIDLYQIHRPDLLAHPEQVAATLDGLRQAGKIREVGVSNHTAAQLDALQAHLPFPVATHQSELSVLALEPFRDGVLDQCMRSGVRPLAWSPLGGGRLMEDPSDDARLGAVQAALDRLAQASNTTREAMALAFLLAHPAGIVPIVGTQNVDRIRALGDVFRITLSRRDWYEVYEASLGEPLP